VGWNGRNRGTCGQAWFGKAPWWCDDSAGLRDVCGHRPGTLRRNGGYCLLEPKSKADGGELTIFGTRLLRRSVDSRRRERFVAKKFIGRAMCRATDVWSSARWRFRLAGERARQRCSLLLKFAHARSRALRDRFGVGDEVAFDQPSRQQGIAVFAHPRIEQLHDFFSYIRCEIQSRRFVGLKCGLRGCEKKFPIHFLLGMLTHGRPLLMDGVRYLFNNTRQGKQTLKSLWKCVEKADGTERFESYGACRSS
jgi:hypothetical protein